MMKIFSFIIYAIIVSLSACYSSCENRNNSTRINAGISKIIRSSDMITVNLDTLELKVGRFTDIYEKINFIPLETSPEILIGAIEEIQLFNDTLYILDSQSAKSIFVYTLNGKFVRRFGKVGKGPGEWVMPVSFTIDESAQKLYILDSNHQKIYIFSTRGKFITTIDLQDKTVRSHYIRWNNSKLYLDGRIVGPDKNKPRYLLRQIDFNGNDRNHWFPIPKYNKGWDNSKYPGSFSRSSPLSRGINDIKYVDFFMDTIFSISNKGVRPEIVLQSKDLISREKLTEISKSITNFTGFYIASIKEDFVWCIRNYVENDDIIRFIYSKGSTRNEVLIDKKTKAIKHNYYSMDDLTFVSYGGEMYTGEIIYGVNKMLIGKVPSIRKFQESLSTNKARISASERDFLTHLPITNNPILFILQTK